MTAWELLMTVAKLHHAVWSTEKPCQVASNSELKRWIHNGALEINHQVDRDPQEIIDYPVVSIVVHPKSTKRRTTLR